MIAARRLDSALVLLALSMPGIAWASAGKIEKIGTGSTVKVSRGAATMRLHEQEILEPGDDIITDASTAVDIRLEDETLIRVGVNSSYKVQEEGKLHGLMHTLLSGVVRVLVPKDFDHKSAAIKFRMATPEGTIGVRGTEFVVQATPGKTRLKGLDGEVLFGPVGSDLTDATTTVSVKRGFESEINAGAKPAKPEKFDLKDYTAKIGVAGGSFGPLAARNANSSGGYTRSKSAPAATATVASAQAPATAAAKAAPEAKEKAAPVKDWQLMLMTAIEDGSLEQVKAAIAHGADVNARTPGVQEQFNTPIEWAIQNYSEAESDSVTVLAYLLRVPGAKVNGTDQYLNTPLMAAAHEGLGSSVGKILVCQFGADYTRSNKAGKTAAQIAHEANDSDLENYLNAGAEADIKLHNAHQAPCDK